MRKMLFIALALLGLFTAHSVAFQNQDARVRQVIAETADGVVVTAWVDRQAVRLGQDIIINYRVENRSRRTIYLVRDNTAEISFEDDKEIIIPTPFVPLGGHEPYDYSYTRVPRGRTHQARFVVAGDRYPRETRYAEQIWRIKIGFGYITDISGLLVEHVSDPAPYKELLSLRITLLVLDGLTVEILESR